MKLKDDQLEFVQQFVSTTKKQIKNSKKYLENKEEEVALEDCFRPSQQSTIKKYKLFSMTPFSTLVPKYMDIDYTHLRSLLLKVKRLVPASEDLLKEEDDLVENRHEKATKLFSQMFDFEKLSINLNK
jgi:hypothetical protein